MELALVGNPEEGTTLPVHEIVQEHRVRKIGVSGPKSESARMWSGRLIGLWNHLEGRYV